MRREGRYHTLAALVIAGLAGWVTIATTTRFVESTSRFVGFGLAIFLVAVVTGSRFGVGGAVLVALGGAAIEIGTVPAQRWERSLVIAVLWYLAAELAWDSMERRDGRRRSWEAAVDRIREVGSVVALSVAVTMPAVALAGGAPPRNLVVLAATVGGLAIALIVATRHLTATGRQPNSG